MGTYPYKDSSLDIERRIDDLISRMTIEEKADQLIQIPLGADENPNNVGRGRFRPTVGSILSSRRGAAAHNEYQRIAVEETRLGIPILFGQDVIHGCYTIFPHSIAQACSFDPDLARKGARIAAREASAMGFNWTFSPMIDVARDPRWGRVVEGYGEDPYLNGVFGAAVVVGYQGDDLSAGDSIAACLKHFVAYGASEGGRDYAYTDVSDRALWETYLPPYRMGVEAGVATVMSSFNDITGMPAVANHYTLTEVLRNRFRFDGFVVSDWASVSQLEAQGFSADPFVQTKCCLEAGNDMDMADQVYANIPELVDGETLDEAVVDEAVRRVLRIKMRLGLFEHPYFEEKPFDRAFLLPDYKAVAEEMAAESLVLLKNELLPLGARPSGPRGGQAAADAGGTAAEAGPQYAAGPQSGAGAGGSLLAGNSSQSATLRVAVIGPAADDADAMLGSWRCLGRTEDTVTILDGLRSRVDAARPGEPGHGVALRYARGCDFDGDDRSGFDEAVRAAGASDVLVLCMGEAGNWSGENASRAFIELPPIQESLIDALADAGKPIVLVLAGGRPLGLQTVEPKVGSILQVWQPGTMAGFAVADVLLGRRSPSGKLAVSFPRTTGHIPTYYCEHVRARPTMGGYRERQDGALFEFGHGLSYTTFEYGEMTLSTDAIRSDGSVTVELEIGNSGESEGTETVLWYIRDPEATITQPRRRLIAFERVALPPGASARVALEIHPGIHLSYPDSDGDRILEPGRFIIEASRRVSAEFRLLD